MNRIIASIAFAAMFLAGVPIAQAATSGSPASSTDHRIKTFWYDPYQVYEIEAAFGFVTVVYFDDGEIVESVFVGDRPSWETTPVHRQDQMVIKPLTKVREVTNMTVETSRRTYTFLIRGRQPGYAASNATFRYHFEYPEEVLTPDQLAQRAEREERERDRISGISGAMARARRKDLSVNTDYLVAGDQIQRPVVMFDDGKHTYLRLNDIAARPAIFAVEPGGTERLVNTTQLSDGSIQVHGVYPQLSLRDGDYLTCLFNRSLHAISENRSEAHNARFTHYTPEDRHDR